MVKKIKTIYLNQKSQARAAVTAPKHSREELPHTWGQGRRPGRATPRTSKEQQLRFAGAAVKRYPTSRVRENQVRR